MWTTFQLKKSLTTVVPKGKKITTAQKANRSRRDVLEHICHKSLPGLRKMSCKRRGSRGAFEHHKGRTCRRACAHTVTDACVFLHARVYLSASSSLFFEIRLTVALNCNPLQEVGSSACAHTRAVSPLLTAGGYLLATLWLQVSLQLSGQLLFTQSHTHTLTHTYSHTHTES